MLGLSMRLGALVAIWTFFPFLTIAQQNSTTTSASTFYLEETETQFSLNVANDSDDVFIYFTSPAYSWVGVGFGQKMEDSLMFIMYPNKDDDNVTISPRFGSNKAEPTFAPSINLEILPGTHINDSMLILRAVCHNCRSWPGGSLALKAQQPMIYAFGHGSRLNLDSPSANLKRHIRYGHFDMDMVAATGAGGIPAPSTALNGVKISGDMVRDHDRANLAHAIIGCLALFVIWPLNVLVAGFFKNIRIHIGISVVVMAFLIVSYALGISTSAQYNRSKTYTTPHQIFALISLAPILALSLLPIPPLSRLHALMPRMHTPLVSSTFLLLIITGGLGLHLSAQSRPIILGYTAVSLLVFLFSLLLTTCIRKRGSAYARQNRRTRLGEEDEMVILDKGGVGSERSSAQGQAGGVQAGYYGGGTMPGPQYLLNMHPGVPVHRW